MYSAKKYSELLGVFGEQKLSETSLVHSANDDLDQPGVFGKYCVRAAWCIRKIQAELVRTSLVYSENTVLQQLGVFGKYRLS
jgi:hypothetical protein